MKTYKDQLGKDLYLYYYDTNIKYWTILKIDLVGNQISKEAEHYYNKKQLLIAYPKLKFTKSDII